MTAYEMRISDWSSDVCSSDLLWAYGFHRCAAEPPSFSLPAASGRLLEVRQQRHHPRRQAMKQKADFIITGRIGKIDAKEKVAHIDVATKYPYKDKDDNWKDRSEEHTSELQSLMRISYAVFCL